MDFGMLTGITDIYFCLLPMIRVMSPLIKRNELQKFLRNVGFCLITRICGIEFPLDLKHSRGGTGEKKEKKEDE